jgi:hypothetical protein
MNEMEWRAKRNDRTLRYAERVLDSNKVIRIEADSAYVTSYDGQVAIITAANLLGRMTPSVLLDVPDVPIVRGLPWYGQSLKQFVYLLLSKIDPWAMHSCLNPSNSDFILHLGSTGYPFTVHGSGWNVYLGPSPSPIQQVDDMNPIGPALSVVIAISYMFFHNLTKLDCRISLNALDWSESLIDPASGRISDETNLGDLWTVGTGSVGTAILYFLTMANRNFKATIFDMDIIEIHNLDRSPIFLSEDVGRYKVDMTQNYLNRMGIDVRAEAVSLDESAIWKNRGQEPDIIIPTANERNVRPIIEHGMPPVQIYGTTGTSWQASVIRHWPISEPCSCCLFPETNHIPTACATGSARTAEKNKMDAALPFLSFAAGIMAAAELLKLNLPGYPFPINRATLYTWDTPRIVKENLYKRPGCLCGSRSESVHKKMITGTKYHRYP